MKKNNKYFVSIAGNIGSGKSSLTRLTAKELGWIPYFESVKNNPYLEDFYKDMTRWSFQLQVYFLSHRFRTHKDIIAGKSSIIQDRSIYEDVEIFARNLALMGRMEKRDYQNYKLLFKEMASYLKPPDLVVYLKASTETLVKQISIRGRHFETNIENDYLDKLNRSYNSWINRYTYGKKIIIESDMLDFVGNRKDLMFVITKIKSCLN